MSTHDVSRLAKTIGHLSVDPQGESLRLFFLDLAVDFAPISRYRHIGADLTWMVEFEMIEHPSWKTLLRPIPIFQRRYPNVKTLA